MSVAWTPLEPTHIIASLFGCSPFFERCCRQTATGTSTGLHAAKPNPKEKKKGPAPLCFITCVRPTVGYAPHFSTASVPSLTLLPWPALHRFNSPLSLVSGPHTQLATVLLSSVLPDSSLRHSCVPDPASPFGRGTCRGFLTSSSFFTNYLSFLSLLAAILRSTHSRLAA